MFKSVEIAEQVCLLSSQTSNVTAIYKISCWVVSQLYSRQWMHSTSMNDIFPTVCWKHKPLVSFVRGANPVYNNKAFYGPILFSCSTALFKSEAVGVLLQSGSLFEHTTVIAKASNNQVQYEPPSQLEACVMSLNSARKILQEYGDHISALKETLLIRRCHFKKHL